MPKELERMLMSTYERQKRKGKLKGASKGQYTYGAMRKTGWKPKREMK